ncbi:MAG TPA: flavin reductase [Prolixibacteraceae bacterium]|jgi:flavin reductase (DIM6/NTAB) family NADH-FMN oxidoreductase RutF/rubredoxin
MKLKAFHKLSYGMYLIASQYKGKKFGYIANTTFQVTSEPEQLAISCHKKNKSTQAILDSGIFSVSVLKRDLNLKIIGDFGFMSSSDLDKFHGINTMTAKTGAPIVLDSSVAWFDCRVVRSMDLGSHFLIIGEVVDSDEISNEEPLTYQYYREKYKMLSPKNSPTYIEKSALEAEAPALPKVEVMEEPEHEHIFDGRSWVCVICGYTYEPEEGDPTAGIPPGTSFEDLPEDWKCPICNAAKEFFQEG